MLENLIMQTDLGDCKLEFYGCFDTLIGNPVVWAVLITILTAIGFGVYSIVKYARRKHKAA